MACQSTQSILDSVIAKRDLFPENSENIFSPPVAFGGKLKNPLHVALVATHADIVNLPRSAGGDFHYDKDTSLLKEIRNR